MHMIREGVKFDPGIKPQVGGAAITGQWFRMDTFAKGKFTPVVSLQQDGEEAVFKVYEATDATGSAESQLGGVGTTITMLQGVKVIMAQVVMTGSVTIGDTIKLTPYYFNGEGVLTAGTLVTYTAAAAESLPNRQFINTALADAATSLAACINDATYGVPGLLAAASDVTVTITATEPGGGDRQVLPANNGTGAFDITELAAAAGRLLVTDLIQQADFEVYVQDLDRDNDFTHIGARFTAIETDVVTFCGLERAMAGYGPVGQAVTGTDTSA